ncbi:SAM-dependent methyltransferase [Streptomyces sp. HSW2009]|uniref:SAM-dependent methyltransferase n=1 Tax=Streptomyces sp. HSW2009 TaxID=3142890 RepID=UPI0032EEACD2
MQHRPHDAEATRAPRPEPAALPPGSEPGPGSRSDVDLRTDLPHSARVWNYWLGGKDHYPADEELGRRVAASYPQAGELARASRAFQDRAVRQVAADGVDQFVDLGTGLPTAMPTHRSAQDVRPAARIVYVDNDPVVLAHARALLTSAPGGATAYVEADLRDPGTVLAAAARTVDLTRPTALLALSTLGHLPAPDAADLMHRYLAHLAPGSFLITCDTIRTPETLRAQQAYASGDTTPYWCRDPEEILACARGLTLLDPGLVPVTHWRPAPGGSAAAVDQWGLVARKP